MTAKNSTFSAEVTRFLQDLDAIQRSNVSITLAIHTGDGVWVTYQGQKLLFLKPAQQFLKLHVFEPLNSTDAKGKLIKFIRREHKKRKDLFPEAQNGTSWISWRIASDELRAVIKFLKSLPAAKKSHGKFVRHARTIPGVIRQAVLQEFENNGSICPGVDGKTKRHKLAPNQGFEFDHIFPSSRRGSSLLENVQVLCTQCNRLKGATAL
jgi:5-methylcytosine-specific restriction endonuclease McrA